MFKHFKTWRSSRTITKNCKHFFNHKVFYAGNTTSINLNQVIAPKQPVPDLGKTVQRYLKSVKPLLSNTEYRETEEIAKKFERGIGTELQRKLMERYESMDNWLSGLILHGQYLSRRDPLVFQSSPGEIGPLQNFTCPKDALVYAGKVISAICDYDRIVKSGEIGRELAVKQSSIMQQYPMVLGTHRRPKIPVDSLLHTDDSKHIIVLHNNHIFKLRVLSDSGTPLGLNQLVASLEDLASRSSTVGIPVGILTGYHRDKWAADHEKLRSYGNNEKIFEDIENAMFVLCLDKPSPKDLFKDKNNNFVRAMQTLTGISLENNAGNRWYDKCLQYLVSYDGHVGFNFEHSAIEMMPLVVLHDHVLKYAAETTYVGDDQPEQFPRAQQLELEIPHGINDSISAAASTIERMTKNLDLEYFTFEYFGKDKIKQNKLSLDSFIQMGVNLAYYRVHEKTPAHMEPTALAKFRNSRTERVRCTSTESVEFARTMLGDNPKDRKREAMMKAIDTHKRLAIEAATGQGVERHLFGLKMLASMEGLRMPEIFSDIGYTRSSHFDIIASQVASKTSSIVVGGTAVPDGYGCGYNPQPGNIIINISALNSCKETSARALARAVEKSLCEMMDLATA